MPHSDNPRAVPPTSGNPRDIQGLAFERMTLADLAEQNVSPDEFIRRALQRLRTIENRTVNANPNQVTVSVRTPEGGQVTITADREDVERDQGQGLLNQIAEAARSQRDFIGGSFTTSQRDVLQVGDQEVPFDRDVLFSPKTSSTQLTQQEIERGERRRVPPRFSEDNILPFWSNLDPLARKRITDTLNSVGLVSVSDGSMYPDVQDAIAQVMGLANIEGLGFFEALDRTVAAHAEAGGGAGAQRPTFQVPAYTAPDWASLAQDVKGYAEQRLSRRLREWEVPMLADELAADHRKAYEQIVEQGRLDFDAAVRAQDMDGGEVATPSAGAEVDPIARFRERFDELYQPEIEAEEAEADTLSRHALLMQSLSRGDDVMGGGV